jgi:DNA repair exonuclease SbcCD ATPase subunit
MFRKSFRRLGTAVLIGGMPLLAAQATGSIVCWTDESGQRACGDRVPPQYARQERKVYDATGRVVETLPRQRTAEEIAAEARRVAELEEQRRQAEAQVAYDRFLVSTYADLADLERSRDESLGRLDSRLNRARDTLRENRRGVEQLKAQIADFESGERKVPSRLPRELATFEKAVADNEEVVEQLLEERDEARLKFERDIKRYRSLKGLDRTSAEAEPTPADPDASD